MRGRIVRFVEENYRERITFKGAEPPMRIQRNLLSTWFKANIGLNFYDYLMRVRLREATLELCSTDKTILEVAGDNRFGDVKSSISASAKPSGNPRESTADRFWREIRGWISKRNGGSCLRTIPPSMRSWKAISWKLRSCFRRATCIQQAAVYYTRRWRRESWGRRRRSAGSEPESVEPDGRDSGEAGPYEKDAVGL